MAAMRREKQYDMFDVATGACTLGDYLTQRYSENDLSSSFWIEEKDEVDELRAPKPLADGRPGTEPEVVPIQGPRAPTKPTTAGKPKPPEGIKPDKIPVDRPSQSQQISADGSDSLVQTGAPATPSGETFERTKAAEAPSLETFSKQGSEADPAVSPEQVVPTPNAEQPPSMEALLARFHQATQEYKQRAESVQGEPSEPTAEE